jgi:hypothetical protein
MCYALFFLSFLFRQFVKCSLEENVLEKLIIYVYTLSSSGYVVYLLFTHACINLGISFSKYILGSKFSQQGRPSNVCIPMSVCISHGQITVMFL